MIPAKRLRRLNALLSKVEVSSPSLDADELITRACRKTGRSDLGGASFREPLARLVSALEDEAALSPVGRRIAQTRLEGALINRLLLQADRAKFPALHAQRIEKPLFIVGMPRTGTTILFHLLAQDPAQLTPMQWKLDFPSPPPAREPRWAEARLWQTRFRARVLYALLPELRLVHTIDAELPHECVVMMGHEFTSIVYSIPYRVPSYEDWLLNVDFRPAYVWHRRFLEQFQLRVERPRWILKSPTHLLSLDALFEKYPDARIVWTHRDPVEAVPSLASLTGTLRALSSEAIDPEEVGARAARFWAAALDRARVFRAAHTELADHFLDVEFDAICKDPLHVLRKVDAHFGLGVTEEAWGRMQAFARRHPRHEHGVHRYEAADSGLVAEDVRKLFSEYRRAFGFSGHPE